MCIILNMPLLITLYLVLTALVPQLGVGVAYSTPALAELVALGLVGLILAALAVLRPSAWARETALLSTFFLALSLLGQGAGLALYFIPIQAILGWQLAAQVLKTKVVLDEELPKP